MIMEKKVSAIIATYNRGYIVADAIASVLSQSYRELEVLVVDDGSTDNTREVVEGYRDSRVHYIRHDHNQGASAAYNAGIAAATGHFVGILDSDDIWKPDYLKKQVDFFERRPDVDIVFCDTELAGSKFSSLIGHMKSFPLLLQANPGGREYVFTGRQMYLCLLKEVPIKPSAAVIRKEVFDRAGVFDEARRSDGAPLVPFTDWELFLRFSRSAGFGYINEPLVIQRRTADAVHQTFRLQDKLFLLNLFVKEKAKLKNDREALLAVNRGIFEHSTNLGGEYLVSGQRAKSLATYARGFKETHEPIMLARAVSTLLPPALRTLIKRAAKRDSAA